MKNFLSCDKRVWFSGQGLAYSPLSRSFFSQLPFFSVRFQNGRRLLLASFFSVYSIWFYCRQATFPWDLRGTIWYHWYQIILHALISKISDIAPAWTASIIIFFDFSIENIQAKWMQAHMPSVIHALFSEKHGIPYGYSLSCRSLWILSLASP